MHLSYPSTSLINSLRSAPYAALSLDDVELLINKLMRNPQSCHSVADELAQDAGVHDWVGNCIKAELVRDVARLVIEERCS